MRCIPAPPKPVHDIKHQPNTTRQTCYPPARFASTRFSNHTVIHSRRNESIEGNELILSKTMTETPTSSSRRSSGMRWVSSARQRLHRPSSSRRKPSLHEWGDIDGPGERSETTEFMPIVPFEPERMLRQPNYYYLEDPAETEQTIESDADTEVYSWSGTMTPTLAATETPCTSVSSASLLSSRNSVEEVKYYYTPYVFPELHLRDRSASNHPLLQQTSSAGTDTRGRDRAGDASAALLA